MASSRTRTGAPRTLIVLGLFLFFATTLAHDLTAQTAAQSCVMGGDRLPRRGESVGLLYGSNVPPELIDKAIELWASCNAYATGFPRILDGRPGTRSVEIVYQPTLVGSNQRCGAFRGNKIVLFGAARDEYGRITRCGNMAQNLAHELGHVFGLLDAPRGRECRRTIMTRIRRDNARSRAVSAAECTAADHRWMTEIEFVIAARNREVGPDSETDSRIAQTARAIRPVRIANEFP